MTASWDDAIDRKCRECAKEYEAKIAELEGRKKSEQPELSPGPPRRLTDRECASVIGGLIGGLVITLASSDDVRRAVKWWAENGEAWEELNRICESGHSPCANVTVDDSDRTVGFAYIATAAEAFGAPGWGGPGWYYLSDQLHGPFASEADAERAFDEEG